MTNTNDTFDVLFDTTSPAYRGFRSVHLLERSLLGKTTRLSETLAASTALGTEVARMTEPLQIVLFGWIDQAIFEVHRHSVGNRETVESVVQQLDVYRPDQGGDLGLAIGEFNWHTAVLVEVSFDEGTVSLSKVKRDALQFVQPDTQRWGG